MRFSLFSLIGGVALLIFTAANADDRFQCGQHMVHVGDSRAEVLKHCGQPTTEGSDTWTYDRGSDYLPVTVHFEADGTVNRIQEGDTM
jgi:hypothetical protein